MRFATRLFPLLLLLSIRAFSQTPVPTATATPPPLDSDDVVRISTTLIQVDATVTFRNGKPVTDLRRDEIEIYENGVKQEITNFMFVSASQPEIEKPKIDKDALPVPPPPTRLAPNQVRRTIALVVDDLTLSFESTHFVRRALKNFVDNQMQEGDLVAIIRTGGGIGALQQFTSDKRQLYAAIEKVRWRMFGGGGITAFAPIESDPLGSAGERPSDDTIPDFESESEAFRGDRFAAGTLGAIEYIVRGMRELPGRKSVMLMSDGFALTRVDSLGFTRSTRIWGAITRLIDLANRSSVVIYTMDARGLQTFGPTAADNLGGRSPLEVQQVLSDRRNKLFDTQAGLNYLAKLTGGISIRNNNDLNGGIERMLDDQSYYLIGYQPDGDVFDPQKRKFNILEVKVTRKDVDVRYRSGFFGITDEQIKSPTKNMTDTDRILYALTSPFSVNELSMHLNAIFKGSTEKDLTVHSILYIELKDLNFTTDTDGTKKAAFDLLALNFGDNGNPTDSLSKTFTLALKPEKYDEVIDKGIIYSFNFPIKKSGAYQMRVAIRDHGSQRVGSASQFIEIPKLSDKRIKLSGIVVDNLSYQEWNLLSGNEMNRISAPDNSAPEGLTPLADTAIRKFQRGTVLNYALEAYNSVAKTGRPPQLEIQSRVFRNGKLLFESSKTAVVVNTQTDLKAIPLNGAINLGTDMEAGDYALQIVVTDTLAKKKRQIAVQHVQFEIVE